MFWPTFVSKFVAKNFQKSPNLVTLKRTVFCLAFIRRDVIGDKLF